MQTILFSLLAYLLGSIPFGLLIARTQGVDIRKQGSGNIGATNVLRCLGKPLGITCFVLDVLKGYLPAAIFPLLAGSDDASSIGILYGALSILGHNFPIFLKFKGGKGIATSAGVLIGIAPLAVLLGIISWGLVFYITGYVSLGSVVASVVVALTGWFGNYGRATAIALTLLGALAVWRHRANIQRLIAGTENKFDRKKKKS